MTEVDLDSQVGIGILGQEAFVTVIPPLSDEEVQALEQQGVIGGADEVRKLDESAGIVA